MLRIRDIHTIRNFVSSQKYKHGNFTKITDARFLEQLTTSNTPKPKNLATP
jgi:hypothetical protein